MLNPIADFTAYMRDQLATLQGRASWQSFRHFFCTLKSRLAQIIGKPGIYVMQECACLLGIKAVG